ncbi:histidine kinase [Pollutimonas subterranea]|uniref:Histidine kinase n=1 Tax=Pollutimonas subterranea TaxID=2045210 RepID=A0A2N4U7B8_9BURK|nr:alpha-hydroxy-acid oxidizing protein [Pollutimonas subterranea]PLC50921.1 histidine kinase [Pollutimonas subterranea]
MNDSANDLISATVSEPANRTRRDMFRLAGAGFATAALSASGLARAQVKEEAGTESMMIERKGINKDLRVFNIDLLEEEAKQKYGHGTYVFVSHGSGDQWTLRENRRAFGDYVFTPHRMQGIVREKIDTSVTLLGEKLPHPVIVTPFGSHGLHHPAGEVATAEGAARSGALLTVSSASTRSMEDIAKASAGPKWFQMYLTVDAGQSKEVLLRARDAGFKAIVFTVDAIGQGSSDEYMRLGNPRPWLPYGNFPTGNPNAFKTNLTWDDLEFIGATTGLPVIVKGVTRPEDAVAAVKAGAAAIQVSNHGGRALDGTPAAITVLPEIAQALQGDVPIIMDSGIRRGTDIVKALALGANAVAIGRPLMYGLTAGGAGGVNGVMEFMNRELINTVLHSGVDSIGKLNESHVRRA